MWFLSPWPYLNHTGWWKPCLHVLFRPLPELRWISSACKKLHCLFSLTGPWPKISVPFFDKGTVSVRALWLEASETTFYLTKSENVAGGFLGGSVVKNPPTDPGDASSVPGLGRSPRVENGNSLQYSGLENSMLPGYSP